MTLKEFKHLVRYRRSPLVRNEKDLEIIYFKGIPELIEFTLEKKLMGIKNISWIALQNEYYQRRFTNWMFEKNWKATKNELDLFFSQSHEPFDLNDIEEHPGQKTFSFK